MCEITLLRIGILTTALIAYEVLIACLLEMGVDHAKDTLDFVAVTILCRCDIFVGVELSWKSVARSIINLGNVTVIDVRR